MQGSVPHCTVFYMCHDDNISKTQDVLDRPVELAELDNPLWNDKCNWINIEHSVNLNPSNYNLIVIQLNI